MVSNVVVKECWILFIKFVRVLFLKNGKSNFVMLIYEVIVKIIIYYDMNVLYKLQYYVGVCNVVFVVVIDDVKRNFFITFFFQMFSFVWVDNQ